MVQEIKNEKGETLYLYTPQEHKQAEKAINYAEYVQKELNKL